MFANSSKRMKYLLFSLFLTYATATLPEERLILSLGEQVLLPLPSNQIIRIWNKNLVALQKKGGGFSLLARKTGWTQLSVGKKTYKILIFSKEQKQKALKLNQILKNAWGLNWSLSKTGDLQVIGILNRLSDWLDIVRVSKTHNIPYQFKALPGEGLKPSIQHYFKILFKNQQAPEFIWNQLPLVNIPQGASILDYKKKLTAFGLIPQEEPLWLSNSPFIEIEIALIESLHSSGFAFGGNSDTKNTLPSFASLLGFLNFLKNSGQGKTLHHSSIIAQSGQKLKIQSGGQIPFKNYNLKTDQQNAQWKSHGLDLNILPQMGKKGRIELDIQAKISEPLAFASANQPPPLKTQSWQSKIIVNENQIVKIFQLKKYSKGRHNHSRLGFILDIPNSFLSGSNQHKMTQSLFIQAKKKKEISQENLNLNDLLKNKPFKKGINLETNR